MIKEYLEKRKEELLNIISMNKEKYEHNQIAIVESNNKIQELENDEDVASKMFSVKSRENNTYKTQEIRDIESQITVYVTENIGYKKNYENAEKELKLIDQCFEELTDVSRETSVEDLQTDTQSDIADSNKEKNEIDVSRETLDNKQIEFFENKDTINNKDKLVEKLKLCKNLALLDAKRVYVELDELIKEFI